jgi:predicted tellurium resistance membrane protein TerC
MLCAMMSTFLLLSLADPEQVAFWSLAGLAALGTLTLLEIVLGVDNIIFIAILTGRLPEEKRARTRMLGLAGAMVMRLVLLALAWLVMKLQTPLFELPWFTQQVTDPKTHELVSAPIGISGKDLLLLVGGLFLIAKATYEIHHMVDHPDHAGRAGGGASGGRSKAVTVASVLTQIMLLDLVFSLDSVITAVGMTSNYWIMCTAVVIAVGVMMAFANPIANFVEKHPTIKTLALAFLVLIGVLLVADGLHQHLSRGYVYFAMAFSLGVELINIKAGTRPPDPQAEPEGAAG